MMRFALSVSALLVLATCAVAAGSCTPATPASATTAAALSPPAAGLLGFGLAALGHTAGLRWLMGR
jgi:hypothetical protein